jgi:monoamine oxidase
MGQGATLISRRSALLGAGAWVASLAGCTPRDAPPYAGGWIGVEHQQAHRWLRDGGARTPPPPALQRRAGVLIVGAGVAGLAAARALRRAGIDDVRLIELEAVAGGNSRGHRLAGIACPLGAHYLPLPGPHAHEVAELLDELGVRRSEHGRAVYDERHLCHSPQERLYIDGQWQDGLLPRADDDAELRAQYRRFSATVQALQRELPFTIPTARAAWRSGHDALDATTFTSWLDAQGLTHPKLRWHLDYCCRDDYGAGATQVSAWAGLHYYASRHGFQAPGDVHDERDAVLTWPEGNAWLVERLAQPLREHLHTERIALRVSEQRHAVDVDCWDAHTQQVERWSARHVVMALPLFIAQRLLDTAPAMLAPAVASMRYAPWLVANLHLERPLADRLGAAPSWDNVLYGGAMLGYVDAMHQSLRPHAGATVITAYWALGGDMPAHTVASRARLLGAPWTEWAHAVVSELAQAHPDLPRKTKRIDLMRYGHAMSIPAPGVRGSAALRALAASSGRVHFAHSDLSGYSVFEEALFHGQRTGERIAAALRA